MNPKLTKINAEFEKNKAKISELQTRQRELERQRAEIENNDILELVRCHNLDLPKLAALIRTMNDNPASAMRGKNKEETDHEEV